MVANLFGIFFAVRAVLHRSKPAETTMPAGFPALAARLVLADVKVAPVFAESCRVPTLLAPKSLKAVEADRRAAAFLALRSSPAVRADRRAAAFLALRSQPAVRADRRAAAFLALRSLPAVRALTRAARTGVFSAVDALRG